MLTLAVVAASVLIGTRVHAGDEDDRRRLLDEIDRLLDDAADDLDGFTGESSTSDLDRALERVVRVKEKARELERVQGDDSRAREQASRYPAYADRFREAASNLRPLKEAQRTLDEQPRACQDRWRELEARVRSYVDRNDPAGVNDIPRLAQEYGRPFTELLERTARRKDELTRFRDEVRRFSDGDGRWGDVRSELHEAATGISDHWLRSYELVQRECLELSKQERSPMIQAALVRLASSEQGRQALFKELNDELIDTRRLITDVEADSDDGGIKSATRNSEDLRRVLERLKAAAGEERTAREIADRWPGEVEAMARALVALDELKDHQFRVDKAPERCRTEEDRIVRAADTLERLDPETTDVSAIGRAGDDLDAITRAAREGLLEALRKAAETKREVENLARQASNWSPGPSDLRAVDEELDESAADIATHYVKAEATAQTVCAPPALGADHPAAKRARTKVFGTCTKAEFIPLREPVVEYCKRQLVECYAGDDCRTLATKKAVFDKCKAARVTLRDRCYANQQDKHNIEIATVQVGLEKCEQFEKARGC